MSRRKRSSDVSIASRGVHVKGWRQKLRPRPKRDCSLGGGGRSSQRLWQAIVFGRERSRERGREQSKIARLWRRVLVGSAMNPKRDFILKSTDSVIFSIAFVCSFCLDFSKSLSFSWSRLQKRWRLRRLFGRPVSVVVSVDFFGRFVVGSCFCLLR
jgi:hypothetical protein